MISFEPTDEERAIRDEVRKFAEAELRERGRDCEKAHGAPDDLRKAYADLGLGTLDWPERAGGLGLPPVARCLVEEELAWGDAGLALALDGPGYAAIAIQELCADETQAALLPRLGRPGAVAALAIAEADLGAELGRFLTQAAPAPEGGFVLSGRKLFVIHAAIADVFVVVCKGGVFLVEKGAKGLALGREDDRIGLQAARSHEVLLDDVRLGPDARLASDEAPDWAARRDRFLARCWIVNAARQVGIARAALEYATFYAQDRTAFGRKIGTFQGIAFKIADTAIAVDAARWLVWRAAWRLGRREDAAAVREAALACVQANETAVAAAIDCVQVLGGAGFIEDYPAEKWMREARALAAVLGHDPLRNHLAAEREYGPAEAGPAPDPGAAFAAFGAAFGG